jgi:predicted outer membrane protein
MSVRLRTLSLGACALTIASLVTIATSEAQIRRLRERNRADQYQNQPQDSNYERQNSNNERSDAVDRSSRDERQPDTSSRLSSNNQSSNEVNQFFAKCLATANKGEIEMNQWAQDRVQHPEVKQFAEQMVRDHQELAQQLNRIASQQTSAQNSALSRVGEIERSIGQQCHQMVQAKLEQKSEGEFDQCYVGAQIAAHIHLLAALEVISQQTTGDLQQVAREAQPVVESHLQHAEELAQQLTTESTHASRESTTQR